MYKFRYIAFARVPKNFSSKASMDAESKIPATAAGNVLSPAKNILKEGITLSISISGKNDDSKPETAEPDETDKVVTSIKAKSAMIIQNSFPKNGSFFILSRESCSL